MNFKIESSEQAYQSIYINPEAQNWQEVIVFHEPIFEDEIPGVVALKSLRLEKCVGFVLGAPRNKIRYFVEKVKELDTKDSLGKYPPQKILDTLLVLTNEIGGTVVYIQNQNVDGPEEDIQGIEGPKKRNKKSKKKRSERSKQREESESFFDPLTKRKLITTGPHYFDPSLPQMEKEKKKAQEPVLSFLDTSKQKIHSPAVNVYPDNINRNNISLWDEVFDSAVYNFPDNDNRWHHTKACYEKLCEQLQITPYASKKLSTWVDVLLTTVTSFKKAKDNLYIINEVLNAPLKTIRTVFNDIIVNPDSFYIVSEVSIKIPHDTSNALSILHKDHGFKYAIVGSVKNIIKQITERTSITITETNDKYLTAYINYEMPKEEAKLLFPTDDMDKIGRAHV